MDPTTPPDETQPPSSSGSHSSSSSVHGRFEPGTRLGTRYRVVGLLGRGGMGEVYRADDLELNQSVALKFLPERVARNQADLARLRQEVRIARQIAHPNVCRTYDISEADGQVFVVMEYVDGEDLASVLRRLGRPTQDKALEIARQLCLGIGAAHENGVLHRDLKPANIMIDGRGRVRITDFGLAGTAEELAASGGISGTPAYMAPEQQRSGAATIQTDIFSLGLVLYELFTGKRVADLPPTADPTRRDPSSSGGDSSVRMPSSIAGDIDPAVERVILRCLERDPARRPQSAYAVFGALPGGDPLAAAVAAGETPSPELVANAGVEGTISPLFAGAVALVAILSFIGISAIQTPLFRDMGQSPSVLSVRASQILTSVTGQPAPRYSSDGYRYAPEPRDTSAASTAKAAATPASRATAKAPQAKEYWRRWSPTPFAMENLHMSRADLRDPPQAYPGSATLVLDTSGRLVALDAIPPADPDSAPAAAATPNWSAVLEAAGRDAARVRLVERPRAFGAHGDSIVAWRLSDSTAADTTLAVAALGGHIVRVETYANGQPLGKLGVTAQDDPPATQAVIEILLFGLVPLIGSAILARGNIRAKRGDLRGAVVVGLSIVFFYAMEHILASDLGELGLIRFLGWLVFGAPLAHMLLHATTMAFAYLAIEPYVRRIWPSALVSWARLVAGRVKDPLVGRDVLVGVAGGAVYAILGLGVRAVAVRAGMEPNPLRLQGDLLAAMVGTPQIASTVCYAFAVSLLRATQIYTILVILRFVLRNTKLAIVGTLVFFVATSVDWSAKAALLYVGAEAFSFAVLLWFAFRFGYVMVILAMATSVFTGSLAWSLDFNSWVAPQTLFAWALVLAILAYGFVTAVGGKSLFSDPLSDPVGAAPKRGR